MTRIAIRALVALLFCAVAAPVEAQAPGTPFNERDDQYRLLGLKRAQRSYDIARQSYERTVKLHDDGIVPRSELDAARQVMNEAEVNFQQSLLAVLF